MNTIIARSLELLAGLGYFALAITVCVGLMKFLGHKILSITATIFLIGFPAIGILGGAIITERVFGWIGMGTLFNTAINSFDLNLLMGVFFLTATLALLANLVADLLYSVMDPRIRVGAGQ